ncbi:MAG: hypothetical protein AMXMBFR74_26570 [Parvibaculum sp.]
MLYVGPQTERVIYFVVAGNLSLLLGTIVGLMRRERQLLWFIAPFALSQLFVSLAGLMRGWFREGDVGLLVVVSFLAIQLVLIALLVYRTKKAWMGAVPLAFFSATYALMATFIGAMALADDWI